MPGLQELAMQQQAMPANESPPPPGAGENPTQQNMANPEDALGPDEELDSDIGFGFATNFLYEPEVEGQIANIFTAQNPAPAIGKLTAKIVDKVSADLDKKDVPLSPRIWLAKGGVVDRILDEFAEIAAGQGVEFPEAAQSAAFGEVIDALKLAGQAEQRGQQAGQPVPQMGQPAPPPMPQQGPPQGVMA